MKRGPKKPTAAQGNFLADQATRRPTVQPAQPAANPNPFSASGTSTAPAASTGIGQSSSGASPIPSPSTGAISTPASLGQVPSASGQMKGGGSVKKYASGGATETNQYGSWGGANAANAVSANPATYTGTPGYTSPTTSTSGPFSTTPGSSPLNNSNPGNTSVPAMQTIYAGNYTVGSGGAETGGGGSYTGNPMGPLRGAGFDDGGEVEDPGGVDMGQGQEGQAGDLSGALDAVQQAYQYGLQQITGNIPTVPAGPGGDQTQGGPQDRGNQLAANIPTVPAGPGGDQPNPNPFPTKTAPIPFGKQAEGADYTASVARGGSVPSLDAGGVMPPPAAPQPQQPTPAPAGGGVQGNQPPQLMRYLTGADAAPIPHVLRTMQTMQGHGRAARAVASGQTPQQKYAILQALRRLSDNAGTHAKVSLTGNGKIPASLPHAVMFANKKFEYQPTPYHIQFGLKGQKQPTQRAAGGGGIQDPGEFGPGSVGDQNYAMQDQQITADQADAGAPDKGGFGPGSRLDQEYASQNAARGGVIQALDDGGDVGSDAGGDGGSNPTQQLADAGAPITMDVTDLQNGQTQSQDITPDQLQSLTSGTFDSYIGHPEDTLTQALQRASHTSYGPQQGAFGNQGQPRSLEAPQPGPPGEGDISSQAPPAWQNKPENFQESGPQVDVQPGTQGGSTRTFRPQDAEFGVNNQFSGAPTGQVTSSQLPPATEPINNTRDIPGTEIDANGVRRITDPQAYDDFRSGRTNFDFNKESTEAGAQPYSSQAGTPQTNVPDVPPRQPGEPVTVVRANPPGVPGFQPETQEGGAPGTNSRMGTISSPALRAGRPPPPGAPQQPSPQMQAPRTSKAPRASRTQMRRPAPRRVFGRGHAGLGTYQEMPDGTAQYLGPQNLTG